MTNSADGSTGGESLIDNANAGGDGMFQAIFALLEPANQIGLQYAARVAQAPPSRRVQAGPAHKTTRFASAKMGRVIQCESDLELAFVLNAEYVEPISRFYDQPEAVRVAYKLANGRNGGGYKTPDYLAVGKSGRMILVECKPCEQFAKLAAENPSRYVIETTGICKDLALESAAFEMGMGAVVFTELTFSKTLIRNVRFLAGYFDGLSPPSETAKRALSTFLDRRPAVWLDELTAQQQEWAPDDVYKAIANKTIYVDLNRHELGGAGRTPVYKSEQYARAAAVASATQPRLVERLELKSGEMLTWDGRGYSVVNVGATHIAMRGVDGVVLSLAWAELSKLIDRGAVTVAHATGTDVSADSMAACRRVMQGYAPKELEQALRTYDEFRDVIQGKRSPVTSAERTALARYRKEQAISGNGLFGLVLHHRAKGNRTRRISPDVEKIVETCVRDVGSLPTRVPLKLIFGDVCIRCRESHLPAPSRKLFYKIAKALADTAYLKRRLGAKRAYQLQGSIVGDSSQSDRRGSRIWERAFIDGTTCDIELVDRETQIVLGRPYLTAMRDGYSGRHLSYWLSFDPPGALSVMMCLRMCVAAHKRLPDFVVHDGGSEYKATDVELLFATFQRHMIQRRVSKPRDGALIESGFGVVTKELFYCLEGNTQATHVDPRSCTPAINPRALATWTLADLHQLLGEYFFFRDTAWDNPRFGQTAMARYLHSEQVHGARIFSRIEYDHAFLVATMPQVDRGGTRKLLSDGFTLHGFSYYNEVCEVPRHHGALIPVRYDPFDLSRAFGFVDGKWEVFRSFYKAEFHGLSEREVAILSTEIAYRRRLSVHRGAAYAEELAKFHARPKFDRARDVDLLRAHETKKLAARAPEPAEICDPKARKAVASSRIRRRRDRKRLTPYESTGT